MDNSINQVLQKMAEEEPAIADLFASFTPNKLRFPKGFKYKYYRVPKKKGFRQWFCAYSVHRNMNKKFCSWVYEWRGDTAKPVKLREHRQKKGAKTRAYKLYTQRKITQGEINV